MSFFKKLKKGIKSLAKFQLKLAKAPLTLQGKLKKSILKKAFGKKVGSQIAGGLEDLGEGLATSIANGASGGLAGAALGALDGQGIGVFAGESAGVPLREPSAPAGVPLETGGLGESKPLIVAGLVGLGVVAVLLLNKRDS